MLKSKFYVRDLYFEDVLAAIGDSSESNIHVYDYLVVYPLRDTIYTIYSADVHLMHEHFTSAWEVRKPPLAPWFQTEGKRPEKRMRFSSPRL